MSWESSAEYYRIINQTVRERLGGLHSARCLMWSFDFASIAALQKQDRWDLATAQLINAAQRLEYGGADLLLICTNTMHRMADEVSAAVGIPLLHIVDPTAEAIQMQRAFKKVGLLGTAYTMEQPFYRGRLEEKYGLEVLVPNQQDRATVHRIIYEELVQGKVEATSRAAYIAIVDRLVAEGAEAIIFGCTEIMLLIDQSVCPVPVFDTTTLHAVAAADYALAGL